MSTVDHITFIIGPVISTEGCNVPNSPKKYVSSECNILVNCKLQYLSTEKGAIKNSQTYVAAKLDNGV